jgi:hypothetical protein
LEKFDPSGLIEREKIADFLNLIMSDEMLKTENIFE